MLNCTCRYIKNTDAQNRPLKHGDRVLYATAARYDLLQVGIIDENVFVCNCPAKAKRFAIRMTNNQYKTVNNNCVKI